MRQLAWALVLLALLAAAAALACHLKAAYRGWTRRTAQRLVKRHRVRINRFKLAEKLLIRETLLEDTEIRGEAERYAAEKGLSPGKAMERVAEYIDEIVPFFSIISYYKLGHWAAGKVLNSLYQIRVEHKEELAVIPPGSRLVYVMNHRSNADYLLVAYALMEKVALSYAVGEWARVWPLDYLFKSFGSYFIRRGYREGLYHKVLERYVQLVTRQGVTQGFFIEGRLSRDGLLQEPKVGLLDYIAGTLRDPAFDRDIYFVPVGINYDRVLEDRVLLRERLGLTPLVGRWQRLGETARFISKGAFKYWRGRLLRYGYACVNFGHPLSLKSFLSDRGEAVLSLPPRERAAHLKALARNLLDRIGAVVPVTPVPFASALLLEGGQGPAPFHELLARADRCRQRLLERGAYLLDPGGGLDRLLRLGLGLLMMRRATLESLEGFAPVEEERLLLEYYRNSIAQFGA